MRKKEPGPLYARRDVLAPVPELLRLRDTTPLARVNLGTGSVPRPVWLATGYDEVRQVMSSPAFSSQRRYSGRAVPGGAEERPEQHVGNLLDYDPPEHTRLRRMLTPEFTVRRVRRLEPLVAEAIDECLENLADAGPPGDLISTFASPVAIAVIGGLIGVPRDDLEELERRVHAQFDASQSRDERAVTGTALTEYLDALIAGQRAEPGDGLIGMLIREHGKRLSDTELRGLCVLLLLAEYDNLGAMIGLGLLALLLHPDQLALLRADPDGLADRAVEELLRYLTVVHAPTPRTATEDTVIGGQLIAKGETVICSLPAANRDPRLTGDPARLDLTRDPVPHVAFGHGVHHCLGAPLARLFLRRAYLGVLLRFPELRLAVPPSELLFRLHAPVHSLRRLPVAW